MPGPGPVPVQVPVQVPVPAATPVPDPVLAPEQVSEVVQRSVSVQASTLASIPVSPTARADKPLHGLTILVVDDSPTIVKMVVRMLTAAGATVESAKDGREGVEVFKAATTLFDIVVTDIQVHLLHTHNASDHMDTHACTHPH